MSFELDKIMEPGDPVDLDVLTKENTIVRLKSTIQLIKNNKEFYISAPIYKGYIYPIEKGAMIMVILPKDTTGIYTFYAIVGGRTDFESMSVVHLTRNTDISKSQRRKYFRLPYIDEIKVEDPDAPEMSDADKAKHEKLKEKFKDNPNIIVDEPETLYIEMRGKDLSGGGFKALSRRPLKLDINVRGLLTLDNEEIPFSGKVIRCSRTMDTFENYEIGVMFEGMDDQVRSQIISYIFKKQRSMRKKGLI